MNHQIAFIGGGNMASAIIGGLLRQGATAAQLQVVDPDPEVRQRHAALGLTVWPQAGPQLQRPDMVLWAVKPQVFAAVAGQATPHLRDSLHLSVAAGIGSDSIAAWLGTERVVRAMPNTPALIGLGQTGLYARSGVSGADRELTQQVLGTVGQNLWLDAEQLLDAVTALSGSGPAYFFYFIEAMIGAGMGMGLTEKQAHQLAVGTMAGAAELAHSSAESATALRLRVTSKGGTTEAALSHLDNNKVSEHFQNAIEKARIRAIELGKQYG